MDEWAGWLGYYIKFKGVLLKRATSVVWQKKELVGDSPNKRESVRYAGTV
jgi:hypothetical protein